jgi:hypothetical protein
MNAIEPIGLLKQRIAASIIGQEAMLERLLLGLPAEGLPGLRLWCVIGSSSCLGRRV